MRRPIGLSTWVSRTGMLHTCRPRLAGPCITKCIGSLARTARDKQFASMQSSKQCCLVYNGVGSLTRPLCAMRAATALSCFMELGSFSKYRTCHAEAHNTQPFHQCKCDCSALTSSPSLTAATERHHSCTLHEGSNTQQWQLPTSIAPIHCRTVHYMLELL